AVVMRLPPLLLRLRRRGMQPRLDRAQLRVAGGEIGDESLNHGRTRQRIDPEQAAALARRLGAGERVGSVDIHGARAAHTLTAGAAEGQGRVDLVLDPDETVEYHRRAIFEIDEIGIDARIALLIGIVAVDLEFADTLGVRRTVPDLALRYFGILRQRQLHHDRSR